MLQLLRIWGQRPPLWLSTVSRLCSPHLPPDHSRQKPEGIISTGKKTKGAGGGYQLNKGHRLQNLGPGIVTTQKKGFLTLHPIALILVVITCSKKSPEQVQAAAEYSPIVSKHLTQINLSSTKKTLPEAQRTKKLTL